MKKALTVYIDDDCDLYAYGATWVIRKTEDEKDQSVTMQNARLLGRDKLYVPFTCADADPVQLTNKVAT